MARPSYGICLLRYSLEDSSWQVVCGQKNYSYEFIEFLKMGSLMMNKSLAVSLIKGMTNSERLRLLRYSLKELCKLFKVRTYREEHDRMFSLLKMKSWFKKALNTRPKETLWELPKGRPKQDESGISTALREFEEETSIDPSQYNLTGLKTLYKVVDKKTYYMVYYVALAKGDITIDMSKIDPGEIYSVKWISLKDLNKYPGGQHISNIVNDVMPSFEACLGTVDSKID